MEFIGNHNVTKKNLEVLMKGFSRHGQGNIDGVRYQI